MILPRYISAVAYVDTDRVVSFLVRRELGLSNRPMVYALSERGLGQADLVLALLRVDTAPARSLVERVLGRPITVCPSQYLRWPVNGVPRVRTPRLYLVVDNPRRENTPARARWERAFRSGLTVEAVRARGASKRDVRLALRRGWIRLVEAA